MEATTLPNEQKPGTSSVEPEITPPIVFFDGVCGLCNHTVDFLMKRDRKGVMRFATLQGETAARLLDPEEVQSLKSIVLYQQDRAYRKSSAVVRILWKLGGMWKLLGALSWLVPKPLRDLAYTCLAKLRYKFFGKKETCRMPTPEERARFLD